MIGEREKKKQEKKDCEIKRDEERDKQRQRILKTVMDRMKMHSGERERRAEDRARRRKSDEAGNGPIGPNRHAKINPGDSA